MLQNVRKQQPLLPSSDKIVLRCLLKIGGEIIELIAIKTEILFHSRNISIALVVLLVFQM